MEGLYKTLNIIAIILVIIGAVFCFTALFSRNRTETHWFGFTVNQSYNASIALFLLALAIWIGCWFNMRSHVVTKLNDLVNF